jgi:predicted nucleic acid-binding protein
VPNLWHLEIANILISGERRGRCTPADVVAWFGFLGGLPITADDQPSTAAWAETTRLARTHNLSAYDAAYLELALRLAIPLATLDQRLGTAAHAAGVARFVP